MVPDEDTLARRRRVQGEEHPDTLTSASNLAADLRALGQHEAARQLDEDTATRRRFPGELTSPDNIDGWQSVYGIVNQSRPRSTTVALPHHGTASPSILPPLIAIRSQLA